MSAVHSGLTESFWDTTNSEPYPFYERVRKHGEVVWDPAMKAWLSARPSAIPSPTMQAPIAPDRRCLF